MIKTLMVSLLLKNTYQVNCIMYAIKQTPIIKHFLPDGFYGSYKVKCFANVLLHRVLSSGRGCPVSAATRTDKNGHLGPCQRPPCEAGAEPSGRASATLN